MFARLCLSQHSILKVGKRNVRNIVARRSLTNRLLYNKRTPLDKQSYGAASTARGSVSTVHQARTVGPAA